MRKNVIKMVRFGLISVQPKGRVGFSAVVVVVEAMIKAGKPALCQTFNQLDMPFTILFENRA